MTETALLLKLAKKQPILRVKDLAVAKVYPEHVRRLWRKGILVAEARVTGRARIPRGGDIMRAL